MKTYTAKAMVFIAVMSVVPCSALFAQGFSQLQNRGGPTQSVAEPSQVAPPVPMAPEQIVQPVVRSSIPSLPLSEPCTKKDIVGLWKLQHVYESPEGEATQAFNISPIQYIWYQPEGVYGRYKGTGVAQPPALVIDQIKKHSTGLQQYLVEDSGTVYYYQDRVANDVQACFIVANDKKPFFKGDMLQMPPKGQITGRLINHYVRMGGNPNQNQKAQNRPSALQIIPPANQR